MRVPRSLKKAFESQKCPKDDKIQALRSTGGQPTQDEDKKVQDISFEGQGCAISMASASIMTDLVKGKEEHEVKEIVQDFLEMIKKKDKLNNKILEENEKTKLMYHHIINVKTKSNPLGLKDSDL